MSSTADVIVRRAARVLLLNRDDQVLLFRGEDASEPTYWFTVGGGIDDGETEIDAAVRETWEETGLRLDHTQIQGPIWEELSEFVIQGRHYRQTNVFYVARVDEFEVSYAGFDSTERELVRSHRWWSAEEIATADVPVFPVGLDRLVRTAP